MSSVEPGGGEGDRPLIYYSAVKRWTLRILFCLILGAITTVAVAWGIGGLRDWESAAHIFADLDENGIPIPEHLIGRAADGGGVRFGSVANGAGWSVAGVAEVDIDIEEAQDTFVRGSLPSAHDYFFPWHEYDSYALGWPGVALRGLVLRASRIEPPSYVSEPRALMVVKWEQDRWGRAIWSRPVRFLPLRPIWPGFLIDTLFYAAIWGGVFFGFVGAKRFIRAKRGRCPRCGYDLQGNLAAGCPECGFGRELSRTDGGGRGMMP